jgi:hypothetical protein
MTREPTTLTAVFASGDCPAAPAGVRPAGLVFDAAELAARIRVMGRRYRRGQDVFTGEPLGRDPGADGRARRQPEPPRRERLRLPGGLTWHDLRVCDCAGCGVRLLGESHEWVRDALADAHPLRVERVERVLPAPVAGRVAGRPVCRACTRRLA